MRLLKRTVLLLASSGVLPVESVAPYIGLSENDIERLAGLPEHYLSGDASVVHLAKLKNAPSTANSDSGETGVVVPFNRRR